MKKVRQAGTEPELKLRKAIWSAGYRYRLALRIEGCRPDLVFPKQRVAVFVDGCFWHGCPLHYTAPERQSQLWKEKLATNMARDVRQTDALRQAGWKVVRLWEHELRDIHRAVERVSEALKPCS